MNRLLARSACLIALLSGCNSAIPAGQIEPLKAFSPDAIRTPALVVVTPNGILRYYRVTPGGGRDPIEIAKVPGVHNAASMAADGREIAIADQGHPAVVLYDIASKRTRTLADPYGAPIDIAIDKAANIYALNQHASAASTVVMYPARTRQPKELACADLVTGVAIATDNEGDVFANGYGATTAGVIEFPNGPNGPQSHRCHRVALQPEQGYAAGLAVDPTTDDLAVVSDPGSCSGGIEGEMTIYPKPYNQRTARSTSLNGHCVGVVRLNASSSGIFALDRASAFGQAYVIQRSYPQGIGDANYRHRYLGGFTTLPNVLPN